MSILLKAWASKLIIVEKTLTSQNARTAIRLDTRHDTAEPKYQIKAETSAKSVGSQDIEPTSADIMPQ